LAKKLFVKTYGCQMNVYDSARMADVLAPLGYVCVDSPAGADMVILNTCHIREKAAEKVYSELGRLRALKDQRRRAGAPVTIAVAGCVAQAEGEEILRRTPQVDLVVGPQGYHRLPELIARLERRRAQGGAGSVLDTDFPVDSKFDHLPEAAAPQGVSAFLSVQEGCDKFCTFCVVPYTRGAEYSRPAAAIVARDHPARPDRQRLSRRGGAWAWRGGDLGPRAADPAAGRDRRAGPAALHHLASARCGRGADRRARRGAQAHALSAPAGAVRRRPRARGHEPGPHRRRLSGFPGESDRDFAETLRLVTEVGYAQAYSFKFSPRPGTPAAAMRGQVPEPVKAERLAALQALIDGQQRAFNQGCVGRTLAVLLEGKGRKAGQLAGRSPYMQAVHLAAPARWLGRVVDAHIVAAQPNSLSARLLEPPAAQGARGALGSANLEARA
jgi:tRNA-2-methylthio-N6-dimethylallyladenosine synthase